jgi:CheY-like chemotaxis protein
MDATPCTEQPSLARLILVVDDDPAIRACVRLALEDAGYRVRGAEHGQAALDHLQVELPALVLLDLQMPVLDGPGFLVQLGVLGIDIPVVLTSAGGRIHAQAAHLGAAGVLPKPFDIDDLLTIVERFAGREAA